MFGTITEPVFAQLDICGHKMIKQETTPKQVRLQYIDFAELFLIVIGNRPQQATLFSIMSKSGTNKVRPTINQLLRDF